MRPAGDVSVAAEVNADPPAGDVWYALPAAAISAADPERNFIHVSPVMAFWLDTVPARLRPFSAVR
jgi:hypothetical protein